MRSCTLQCKRGRTDNRIGLRDCLSEMKLLSSRRLQRIVTEFANKFLLRFSSSEEDVKIEELHLAVFEDVRTMETVCESALVRRSCCQAEGLEDAEYEELQPTV